MAYYDASNSVSSESFDGEAFLKDCLNNDQRSVGDFSTSEWSLELSELDHSGNKNDKDGYSLDDPLEAFDVYSTFCNGKNFMNIVVNETEENHSGETRTDDSESTDETSVLDFETINASLHLASNKMFITSPCYSSDGFHSRADDVLNGKFEDFLDSFSDGFERSENLLPEEILSGNENECPCLPHKKETQEADHFLQELENRREISRYERKKCVMLQHLRWRRCMRFLANFQRTYRFRLAVRRIVMSLTNVHRRTVFYAWIKFIDKCDKDRAARMIGMVLSNCVRYSYIKSFKKLKTCTIFDRYSCVLSYLWSPIITSFYRLSFQIWMEDYRRLNRIGSKLKIFENTVMTRKTLFHWQNQTASIKWYQKFLLGLEYCQRCLKRIFFKTWLSCSSYLSSAFATCLQRLVRGFLIRRKMRQYTYTNFEYYDTEVGDIIESNEIDSLCYEIVDDSVADRYLKECEMYILPFNPKTSQISCNDKIISRLIGDNSKTNNYLVSENGQETNWNSQKVAKVRVLVTP